MENEPHKFGKITSIVSGKGGSGKTLIASLIGAVASKNGKVLLIDADFGTGGLTYFLTFKVFDRGVGGLCEILRQDVGSDYVFRFSKPRNISELSDRSIELLPIGDHKKFHLNKERVDEKGLREFIDFVRREYDYILFDCRGGIDDDSMAMCRLSDEIVVVAETDAASIRASQHLVEVLDGEGVKEKIRGFIINKAMDDPRQLAELYGSILFADYLGAVPFDVEANRSFIKGDFPGWNTSFSRHCRHITGKVIDDPRLLEEKIEGSGSGYFDFSYGNSAARRGRVLTFVLSLYFSASIFALWVLDANLSQSALSLYLAGATVYFLMLTLLMTSDRFMEKFGRTFQFFVWRRSSRNRWRDS
jgi:flagellar biosynthesis protein FlhG